MMADAVVVGDCEPSLTELFSGPWRPERVPGVTWGKGGRVTTNPRAPPQDLDTYAFPARHLGLANAGVEKSTRKQTLLVVLVTETLGFDVAEPGTKRFSRTTSGPAAPLLKAAAWWDSRSQQIASVPFP